MKKLKIRVVVYAIVVLNDYQKPISASPIYIRPPKQSELMLMDIVFREEPSTSYSLADFT